jgi:hypothetical protein
MAQHGNKGLKDLDGVSQYRANENLKVSVSRIGIGEALAN